MTLQQDLTDANKSTPFCWISARGLIKFHINALLPSSTIMELETRPYHGSRASLRIEASKLSLMWNHLLGARSFAILGLHQWSALQSLLVSTTVRRRLSAVKSNPRPSRCSFCRLTLTSFKNGNGTGRCCSTQTNANTSGSPTSARSYRPHTLYMANSWKRPLKPSTLESL